MKRSHIVALFAGGTALAGVYAYNENRNCQPNAMGDNSSYCSRSSSGSHGGYSSSGGGSSSSHGSVAHGGFGGTGAAHGGGS
jgi:hypothetical protein